MVRGISDLAGHPAMSQKYKRCRRYNDPGDAHALTFSCFHRQAFLSRDRSRQWLVDAVELARGKHEFDLWAYVVMPEHVRLLLWPRQASYDMSKILTTIKQSVTHRALAPSSQDLRYRNRQIKSRTIQLNPHYSPSPSNLPLQVCVEAGKSRGFQGNIEG